MTLQLSSASLAAIALSLLFLGGCGSVSRGEYRTLEMQNRVLSEQNRAQQAEIANLRDHQRKLEDQVIKSSRAAGDNLPQTLTR